MSCQDEDQNDDCRKGDCADAEYSAHFDMSSLVMMV